MTDHSHDPHHGSAGHAVAHAEHGVGKYLLVFVALCVLTGCSFMTYFEFWRTHLNPAVGWAFMMAVSCTKAGLVITFFMHLKYEADWKYVLTIPATIMSVFLTLALIPDIGMRVRRYSEERREFAATPADNEALVTASLAEQHEHGASAPHGVKPAGH
jgi:cytochrome c oxidase subunit 4